MKKGFFPALFLLLGILTGCGEPTPDTSTLIGRKMLYDQVDKALTTEDCATAIELLSPLYNSAYSDNETRLKMAAAYGCNAKVNFLKTMGDLVSNAPFLAGPQFWNTMAKLFPSTAGGGDYVVEGALLGTDALQAALKPGSLVLPLNQVNPGTYNVGSIFTYDRIDDANIYLLFVAMAGIGGLEGRYGNPDPNNSYSPRAALPWKTAAAMDSDGCGFAASVLNFVDAIGAIKTLVPSTLSGTLSDIESTFKAGIDQACDVGCQGVVPPAIAPLNPNGTWSGSGCALSACATCPLSLRDRNQCKAQATDVNSCAAAGIVNMVTSSSLGWQ